LKKMMLVNWANAHKKMGDAQKAKEILESADWSAVSDNFRISVEAVLGEVSKVIDLMERVVKSSQLTKVDFREWPVFDWVRKDDAFRAEFERLFLEPIDTVGASEAGNVETVASETIEADDPGTIH
jgi:hypothetical protein